MDRVLYAVFAAVAVASALLAISRKNAVAAACWLVVMFFGLAGVFVMLEATFVAVVQILVYAGAIMVLFLFVIMLLDLRDAELAAHRGPRLPLLGILLSAAFLMAVVYAIHDAAAGESVADRVGVSYLPPAAGEGAPPPSRAVALREDAERTSASGRTFVGTVASGGRDHEVVVVLAPRSVPRVTWDGRPLDVPASLADGAAKEAEGVVALAGAEGGGAPGELKVSLVRGGLEASPAGGPDGSPSSIGHDLFAYWVLPFEVTSLLLTSAIFGAVVLTKRRLS